MATQNPEIHTDEIALFSRPPVNVAEDRISWHEVRPSYMSNADYSSIIFSINGNSSQYVKLSDTELYVRINIEKEDGTPFTTTNDNGDTLPAGERETGASIDFILHSMWSSVDIKLNNNLISESGTNYMYKALLEALLTLMIIQREFNWLMKDSVGILEIFLRQILRHLHIIMV